MNFILALFGCFIGILVSGVALFTAWMYAQHRKPAGEAKPAAFSYLLQWNVFDYALLGLWAIGSLFLFTDALAVIRDRASYPMYHYGYLLCGFVFTFLGMLFMAVRLSVLLKMIRSGSALAPNQHRHPGQAHEAE